MQRAHKIRLNPNNIQASYFRRACGVRRFVQNWGLAEWNTQHQAGLKPSAYALKKLFNSIKKEQFPFTTEVTKCAAECAFDNLASAFSNFFAKRAGYPKFQKKGARDSFYLSNDKFKVIGKFVVVPRLGKVRMTEELRFTGKIMSAVISERAGNWFVSIQVEIEDKNSETQAVLGVGVDLGIKKLATLSDGTAFENPKATKKFADRIRRLGKSLSRKKKGSANWKKAKAKLAREHYKLSCVRADAIHKMTSTIANKFSDVCVEDLNVKGMLRNKRLAKAVTDASFAEIRRQLSYKSTRIHTVGRFFPSSKRCHNCGKIHEMPLSKRVFSCDCGIVDLDRDLNAAKNILLEGIRLG